MGTLLNTFASFARVYFIRSKSVGKLNQRTENWIFSFTCFEKATKRQFASSSVSLTYKMETMGNMTVSNSATPQDTVVSNVKDPEDVTASMTDESTLNSVAAPESDGKSKPLSKKALKRIARAEKHKEYRKQKKAESLQAVQKEDAGYSLEDLDQSSYYFENGLRKVYPYTYVFATHAKGRWVGRTLKDVLEREFGFDHPLDIISAFDNGMIHVNSKRVKPDYILRGNDYISHRTHRHENPVTAAPIEVIENNDDVVVINKPSSMPCHPCGRYRFNSVVFILGKDMGLVNLRNIYRLDRLTSGVLILGKSVERTRMLMDQVVNRKVQKEYVCRVVGKFPDGTIKVDQPLAALSNKLRLQIVSPKGKSSQTTFTRLSYNGRSSVVRCIPHTGRTHQIRVHLQYLGHPIINDVFYNSDAWGPNKGKDAVYEIPHDKVCERILTEHHVTQWDGGPNPLYEEKMKEVEEKMAEDEKDIAASDMNSDVRDKSKSALGFDEPPPKRRKEGDDGGDTTSGTQEFSLTSSNKLSNDSNVTQKVVSNASELDCDGEKIGINLTSGGKGEEEKITCPEITEKITETSVEKSEQGKVEARAESGSSKLHSDTLKSISDHHPGFEMDKWSIDPLCEICKKKPIDPQEKHLVMFLHALKYKGPGWAYETALPEWAREDWCREEDYMLEQTHNIDE